MGQGVDVLDTTGIYRGGRVRASCGDRSRGGAARQIPYPVLFDGSARALEPWGVEGYPATFVVDAEGHVRHVFRGEIDGAQLAGAIAPLLPETCPHS